MSVKIVTHSGNFHADDIFSVATLDILYKGDIEVSRTRDTDIIDSGDIVLDVGQVYDPDKKRFDHHQPEGAGQRENGIPYASFGLIWKHFGRELCSNDDVWKKIDEKIVQSIDADDVGYTISEVTNPEYNTLSVDYLIKLFNPTWKENYDQSYEKFIELTKVAKTILERAILVYEDWSKSRELVEEVYNKTEDKRLIVLDEPYFWSDVLFNHPEPLLVVFPKYADDTWYVVAIKKEKTGFENRLDLPKEWAGLEKEKLQKVSGVSDAVFCHRALFMAVAKTKEGAIEMAQKALEK